MREVNCGERTPAAGAGAGTGARQNDYRERGTRRRLAQSADLQAVAVPPLEEDGLAEGPRPSRPPREAHHDRLMRRHHDWRRGPLPGEPLADREAVDRQLLGLPPRVDHLKIQGSGLAHGQ